MVIALTLDQYIHANILCFLFSFLPFRVADMQVAPEKIGDRNRKRHQITPVDCHALPLECRGFPRAFFSPSTQTKLPEGECLKRGCLPGIVWADEHNRLAQINLGLIKPLEVLDGQFS